MAIAQANNAARAHCPNGHRYTPDTTYYTAAGKRFCKVCKRAAWDKRRAETADIRRKQYRERRAAGATPYQAVYANWWEYPPIREQASAG